MAKTYKPGQTIQKSGQYGIVNRYGYMTGCEVTGVAGKVFPPTPKAGMRFVPVDYTKHGCGRR